MFDATAPRFIYLFSSYDPNPSKQYQEKKPFVFDVKWKISLLVKFGWGANLQPQFNDSNMHKFGVFNGIMYSKYCRVGIWKIQIGN